LRIAISPVVCRGRNWRDASRASVRCRGERLFRELNEGKTVTFKYIPAKDALTKSFAATRNLDYPTKEIELSKDVLRIEEKELSVQRVSDIRSNLWKERLRIVDMDGSVFFETHLSAVRSLYLMCDLIVRLQEAENPREKGGARGRERSPSRGPSRLVLRCAANGRSKELRDGQLGNRK
jgi:hypothetical protein